MYRSTKISLTADWSESTLIGLSRVGEMPRFLNLSVTVKEDFSRPILTHESYDMMTHVEEEIQISL